MELWNKGTLSLVWFRTVSPCWPGETWEPFIRAHIVFVHSSTVFHSTSQLQVCWKLASTQRCLHLFIHSACVALSLLCPRCTLYNQKLIKDSLLPSFWDNTNVSLVCVFIAPASDVLLSTWERKWRRVVNWVLAAVIPALGRTLSAETHRVAGVRWGTCITHTCKGLDHRWLVNGGC